MSAAFGAGDMTASANNGGGGGASSAANVGDILGNTISLDEILRATKNTVSKKTQDIACLMKRQLYVFLYHLFDLKFFSCVCGVSCLSRFERRSPA